MISEQYEKEEAAEEILSDEDDEDDVPMEKQREINVSSKKSASRSKVPSRSISNGKILSSTSKTLRLFSNIVLCSSVEFILSELVTFSLSLECEIRSIPILI